MIIKHVVVDGSNIATEGRDSPSLSQLDEAVRAFVEEYGPEVVTVVVDATFPNRIEPNERDTYEAAVSANELITPPAGALGRGDGFVLQIANRASATILSNDSFQEFHGRYPWLFDKGRLIGGKPVPHVGWVFMERAPVRGPISRRAVSEARREARSLERAVATAEAASAAAAEPAARSGSRARGGRSRAKATPAAASTVAAAATAGTTSNGSAPAETPAAETGADRTARRSGRPGPDAVNDLLPFVDFVARYPVGSEVEATVERFSSHGAYAAAGEVRGYLPLRNLGDPAPRSAKEVLTLDETRSFVVVSIDAPRRGVDFGLPGVVQVEPGSREAVEEALEELDVPFPNLGQPDQPAPAKRTRKKAAAKAVPDDAPAPAPAKRTRKKKAAEPVEAVAAVEVGEPAPPPAPAKRTRKRKAVEPAAAIEPAASPVEPAPAPAPAKRTRKQAAAKAAPAEAPVPTEPEAPAPAPAKRTRKRKAAEPAEPAAEPAAEPTARKRATRKKAAAKKAAPGADEPPPG